MIKRTNPQVHIAKEKSEIKSSSNNKILKHKGCIYLKIKEN